MIIASLSEEISFEKRISITPEIAKKYISEGFDINLCRNYGNHLGFNDNEYSSLGVNIVNDEKELIDNANILIQLSLPNETTITSSLRVNPTLDHSRMSPTLISFMFIVSSGLIGKHHIRSHQFHHQ